MIQIQPLSQRDSRWGWRTLGFSSALIRDYGCVITCLTMLARETDVSRVNDLLKSTGNYNYYNNPGGAYLGNLVVWGNIPRALKNLKYVARVKPYNNEAVKAHIAKGFPVIVQVDAAPIGAPQTDHYVLFLGDQKLADPWTGTIRPTSDFPVLKGYALYEAPTVNPYKEKCTNLKIAIDRLKSEFDSDLSNPNANFESLYNNTISKVRKIADTGTL